MNIHVGNLAKETDEPQLRESFAKFGDVTKVRIVMDKVTGTPKGFGFVEMPTLDHANAAIAGLNGKDLGGHLLAVSQSRSGEDRTANSTGAAAVPVPKKQ
jgi:RNA recognition motif-containing protein